MTAADPLAQLLAGTWVDPDTGKATGIGIASIVIADSLGGREAELVGALDLGRRLAVVSDVNTHRVLGARVEQALRAVASIESVLLPRGVHPDLPTVERVRAATKNAAVPISAAPVERPCGAGAGGRARATTSARRISHIDEAMSSGDVNCPGRNRPRYSGLRRWCAPFTSISVAKIYEAPTAQAAPRAIAGVAPSSATTATISTVSQSANANCGSGTPVRCDHPASTGFHTVRKPVVASSTTWASP